INDSAGGWYTTDLKDQGSGNNYTYDLNGQLKQDLADSVTAIDWTVYGKIDTIVNGRGTITYTYDAAGNRVTKAAGGTNSIYVRDAQGNILAIYTQSGSGAPAQTEVDLYGSSRLGTVGALTVAPTSFALSGSYGTAYLNTFSRGEKSYELTNHLGNVLSTITDKKIAVSSGSDSSLIDHFLPDVAMAQDYYPFGMVMPGRSYPGAAASSYRWGFNGKEQDNEIEGAGNAYDYGMRESDPRIGGRFYSVDPLTKKYPELTPYQFASNNPIKNIDLDGLEGMAASGIDGQGMIVNRQTALDIDKKVVVTAFKAVFTQDLPKKFIDQYAYGSGQPYRLSDKELPMLHVLPTGLHGGVENDVKKADAFLATIKPGETVSLPTGYSIQGGAAAAGTLGRFTIRLEGTVTKDKKDPTKWSFNGKMQFYDIYDFKSSPTKPGDLQRSGWGDFQTEFADKYLPGKPFEVTSDWIPVTQNNTNTFDWFDGKDSSPIVNRLAHKADEVQKTSGTTGETQKQN
ncbi:MAG TPA: RHS repeat-associated core domain-containing protein, partial [Puia sp.]|nr:RHS repeat-associated core domain-containing protein [Puia sp.]